MSTALFIIAITMLFMFVFVAGSSVVGNAKPLLSVGFFGVFIICLFEWAVTVRRSIKRPSSEDIQKDYRRALQDLLPKRRKFWD